MHFLASGGAAGFVYGSGFGGAVVTRLRLLLRFSSSGFVLRSGFYFVLSECSSGAGYSNEEQAYLFHGFWK